MAEVSLNTTYAATDDKKVKKGLAQKAQEQPVSIYDVLKQADAKKPKKVYKEVKNFYKDNDLKMDKEDKRPNWFQRNILGKKDNNIYRTKALENKQAELLAEGAGEGDVRNKTYNKLKNAGFLKDAEGNLDVERLVEMYEKRAGDDHYINYSHENSEFRQLRADFNEIGRKHGVEFSKKDTKEIIDLIGDKEKWYNYGQGGRRTAAVGATGAAVGAAITINQAVTGGSIIDITQKTTMALPIGAAVAAVTLGADMLAQAFRNEQAVSFEVTHDNAEAYNKYVDESKASKDGKRIMKELATYFTDEKGALDKEAMNKAMREAAGDDSALNIDEAQGLIYKLATSKEEPTIEPDKITTKPTADTPTVVEEVKIELVEKEVKEVKPETYTVVVQNGESLAKLAKKYNVSVDDLIKLNNLQKFTNDCGETKIKGFKVGQTIKLPATANIDAAKNNKTAADAIKDYENMWKKNIAEGKEPCEDDHKVSNAFLEKVRASLTNQ